MLKYVLFCLTATFVAGLSAQIINEDFSTGTGSTPPTGWTITDISGSGVNWQFDDNSNWSFDPNISGMFALLDSDGLGSSGNPEDAVLTSPVFDASAISGNLILEFDHYFEQYSSSTWTVEVYDGSVWTSVLTGNTDVIPTEHVSINITTASGNSPAAQIRFHWTGEYDYYWGVDNVQVHDVTCPDVTAASVSNLSATGADLSWTAGGAETNWIVEYGPAGFTPGTGTIVNVSGTTSTTLSSLTGSTDYDVYITADCGGGDMSNAQLISFTTLCDLPAITSYPWTEDFESTTLLELPCGWQQLDLNNDGYVWQVTDNMPNSGSNSLDIRYNSSEAMNDWAYTPAFTMTAGTTYLLQFDYAVYSDFFPESFEVVASSAQDPGSTITTLGTFSNITNTNYITFVQVFTPATSGDYYFGFHGMSNPDEDRLLIDDILVDLAPSCMAVTDLQTDVITSTSVELTWNAFAGQTNWVIEYGPTGFTPGTGAILNVSSTDETVSGLSFSTGYDFYVFADCGSGDYSDTVALTNVMTLCGIPAITAYPWTEDFESTPLYELPCGWQQLDLNSDDIIWQVTDNMPNSGSNSLDISYSSQTMDDWAYTPAFTMTGGTTYMLQFTYAVYDEFTPESFEVAASSAQDAGATIATLGTFSNLTNTDYVTSVLTFTPATSGDYYFGFHGMSDPFEDDILIDDILVDLAPSCWPVTDLQTDVITSTSVELTWTADAAQTNWMIEYGPAGFTQGSGTVLQVYTTDTVVGGLSFSTSYDFYVFANCGGGDYSDTLSLTATTLCGIPAITSLPWIEDFEATSLDEMPCGWLETDDNGDDVVWGATDFAAQSGVNSLGISYNSSMDMDDWALTPAFTLTAGIPYRFIYSYAVASSTYPENFGVYVGTSQDGASMTNQLADYPGIDNNTFITDTVVFTPSATADYYFGFHGYSLANEDLIMIDDVRLEETCAPESAAFNYSNDTICTTSGIATPLVTGTTGGVFSSNGLNINPSTGSFNPASTPTGTYTVTYISGFTACSDTVTISVVISTCGLGLEENMQAEISVYPNPASSVVHIVAPSESKIQSYLLMDMSGKVVAVSGKIDGAEAELDLSGIVDGLYLVNVITDKGRGTVRISVSR